MAWNAIPEALTKRFRVLEPFAHGSTGSLYLVDESESGRRGLLKVLSPIPKHRDPERARLRRELTKQATLSTERLLVPWASGDIEGSSWLFRPWLEGVSLRVQLTRGPLPAPQALAIAAQLAVALDELHRAGLLHRDVKPGHVFLLTNTRGETRASLIEPGVCGCVTRPGNSTIFGTPGYVAPEQLQGKLVSFRSDLYSLGCLMYEMFAGHPPFGGPTEQAVLAAQLSGEIPPLQVELPDSIHALLRSLLAREPQERPFSAQKLRRLLDPYAPDGAPMTRQPTSTFGTLPDPEKPAQKSASAPPPPVPSMPPAPPAAALRSTALGLAPPPPPPRAASRSMAPPPPPRASTPPSADTTQHLELDQLEEIEAAPAAADRTQELSPEHLVEMAPQAERETRRDDLTVPVRLEQILAIAPAKLRASAAPPPMEAAKPAAEPVKELPAKPVSGPAPASPSGLFDASPSQPTSAPESSMQVDADYLASTGQLPAVSAPSPQGRPTPSSLPPPSESLFGALPPAPQDEANPFRAAFEADDDELDSESTKVSERPLAPRAVTAAGSSIDRSGALENEPTQIHRAPAGSQDAHLGLGDDDDDELAPRRLQDTLYPYFARGSKQRKVITVAASAALLGLLALGASALFGGDDEPVAQRVVAPAGPPSPSPAAAAPAEETTPSATALAPAPAALPEVESAPTVEPVVPERAPAPAREEAESKRASAEPARNSKASATASAASSRSVRTPSRPERAKAKPAPKRDSKDAAKERTAKWAEARDQARAHYAAKRYKQAAQAYERATQFDPTNAGTFAGLGAARLQSGDSKGAIAAYQRAIQLSPSSPGFHVALGRAYVAAGDKTKARASYKRALSIDPKNESAKSSLKEIGG